MQMDTDAGLFCMLRAHCIRADEAVNRLEACRCERSSGDEKIDRDEQRHRWGTALIYRELLQ